MNKYLNPLTKESFSSAINYKQHFNVIHYRLNNNNHKSNLVKVEFSP